MAEEYKLTSTGEFGFAECPLNPGLKSPGTSGFLVVAIARARISIESGRKGLPYFRGRGTAAGRRPLRNSDVLSILVFRGFGGDFRPSLLPSGDAREAWGASWTVCRPKPS
jgi:hypothetical protein